VPRLVTLPPHLAGNPFLYSDAREAGVGAGRLRSSDLTRPFRGVRSTNHPSEVDPTDSELGLTLRACGDYEPLLASGQFFSHITAARLWHIPTATRASPSDRIHVSSRWPQVAPRMVGVSGHQTRDAQLIVVDRHGHPASDPVSTWLALAAVLPLDELVAAGDHLVLDPVVLDPLDDRPYTSIKAMRERAHAFRGRGARNAADALGLVCAGAESRPETLLRLLLRRASLPPPEVNVDVTDASGRWLGRSDLVWEEYKTVVEYDGDGHRTDTRTYENDIARTERFTDARWRMVKVRAGMLFARPHEVIPRVSRALVAGGWRP
jgi:hypothetical protein